MFHVTAHSPAICPLQATRSNDLFGVRMDQIINLKHELVLLAGKIDWDRIDGEDNTALQQERRPGIETSS